MSESPNTPTVVLVHGGFADASFWAPVIEDLQAHNVPVLAPPNPLRGLAHDAEYVASYVNQIDGPVLLVGHSCVGCTVPEGRWTPSWVAHPVVEAGGPVAALESVLGAGEAGAHVDRSVVAKDGQAALTGSAAPIPNVHVDS